MITKNRIKTALTLAAVAMAILVVATTSANAAIIVTPDHISTDPGVQSTLLAIDVPFVGTTGFPYTGGPDWPEDADDGFVTVNAGIGEVVGTNNGRWEPDGTPNTGNQHYQTYNNSAAPDVSYTFDLPDGAIIYAIYATWRTRNKVGGVYTYSEGASSGNSGQIDQSVNPTNDLGLDWTDDVSTVRTAPFQRIFTGPITVAGGDGFTLNADDTAADNAMSIDAVVIDVEFYIDPNLPDVDGGADMLTWSGEPVTLDPNIVEKEGSDWTNLTGCSRTIM